MTALELARHRWIEEHTIRILQIWKQRKPPLGIDDNYARHLKKQLAEYYSDPLKKSLIETSC